MMQSKLAIRSALPEDAAAVAALEKQCFSAPWSEGAVESEIRGGAVFLTAWQAGRLAGYASFRAVCGEGYVGNVAVDPSARRQGVGRLLMERLILQARKQNLAFLTLEVRRSGTAAIGLYEDLGFQKVGERKGFYADPKEDAVLMTMFFKERKGIDENTGN